MGSKLVVLGTRYSPKGLGKIFQAIWGSDYASLRNWHQDFLGQAKPRFKCQADMSEAVASSLEAPEVCGKDLMTTLLQIDTEAKAGSFEDYYHPAIGVYW